MSRRPLSCPFGSRCWAPTGAWGGRSRGRSWPPAPAPSWRLPASAPAQPSIGKDAGALAGGEAIGLPLIGSLPAQGDADVWIDFTVASDTEPVAVAATAAEAAW